MLWPMQQFLWLTILIQTKPLTIPWLMYLMAIQIYFVFLFSDSYIVLVFFILLNILCWHHAKFMNLFLWILYLNFPNKSFFLKKLAGPEVDFIQFVLLVSSLSRVPQWMHSNRPILGDSSHWMPSYQGHTVSGLGIESKVENKCLKTVTYIWIYWLNWWRFTSSTVDEVQEIVHINVTVFISI